MHVQKPDNVLLNQAYHTIGGQAYVFLSLSYLYDQNNLIDEQQAWPYLNEQASDEPFDSGLKKARGTFGVTGKAYALGEAPVKVMQIGVQIGQLNKNLAVIGDRFWLSAQTVSDPQPFTTMPVDLSHAFGGIDSPENVYGKGWLDAQNDVVGQALPNIELIDKPILGVNDKPAVATFGALPHASKSRADFLGEFNQAWLQNDAPWIPRASQTDWFDQVPPDQHINDYWLGNESWTITGMHPDKPQLTGQLPNLRPRLLVKQAKLDAGKTEVDQTKDFVYEAKLDLDTVWFYPHDNYVLLIYRAAIAVHREDGDDILAISISTELNNEPATSTEQLIAQTEFNQLQASKPSSLGLSKSGTAAVAGLGADMAINSDLIYEQAQAEADKINSEIIASLDADFDEAFAERERIINELKNSTPALADFDLAAPAKPDYAQLLATDLGQPPANALSADELRQQITDEVHQELEQARADIKQQLQEIAKETELDEQILLDAMAANQAPTDLDADLSATDIINKMPIPAEIKAGLLGKAAAFDAEMVTVDQTIAAVRQQVDDLYSKLPGVYGGLASGLKAGQEINLKLILDYLHEHQRNLCGSEIADIDFSGQDLSNVDFTDCKLKNCNFTEANLTGANFQLANIKQCNFTKAQLENSNFNQANLEEIILVSANLINSNWAASDTKNSNFSNAKASKAIFRHATISASQLDQIDLQSADLTGASLGESSLNSASCQQANLQSATFWAVNAKGADFQACLATDIRIDSDSIFSSTNFAQAQLNNASLQATDFTHANFNQANLDHAYLDACDLGRTTAWQLQAKNSTFKNCNISNANWVAANLMQANFDYAKLINIDLSGANLYAVETRTASLENLVSQDALVSRSAFDPEFKGAI